MVKVVQIVRQETPAAESYVGPISQLIHDLTTGTIRVHDGSTEGGTLLATRAYADAAGIAAQQFAEDYVTNGFVTNFVQFAGGTGDEGKLGWNVDEGTLDLTQAGGDVILQLGHESLATVLADTDLTDGDVIYISGAVGASGFPRVAKYVADGSISSDVILGVATEAFLTGEKGQVTERGKVRGVNTTGVPQGETWGQGTVLYASAVTAGGLTSIPPEAPNLRAVIAIVINAHATQGTLYVRPRIIPRLIDLSDITLNTLTDKQVIAWDDTAGHFTNVEGGLPAAANTWLKTQTFSIGPAVDSATGITVGDGNYFLVNGTTNIETIATKGIGTVIWLVFTGTLTLVNSTNLQLRGNGDIVTEDGDTAVFQEIAEGVWKCQFYQRQAASPDSGGGDTWFDPVTLSGASTDITGIPSTARQVDLIFNNVSITSLNNIFIRLGDSGGFEATGYVSNANSDDSLRYNDTTQFVLFYGQPAALISGRVSFFNTSGNTWVCELSLADINGGVNRYWGGGGHKTLSGTLDRVQIITNSTSFDSGSVTLKWR